MKRYGKLAAACVLVAVLTTLTACGNSVPTEAELLAKQMDGQIVKSKITSADSTAHALTSEVNAYIAECLSYGGKVWEGGTIKLTAKSGNWSISGYNADAYRPKPLNDTLVERIRVDFSDIQDAYAEIHINEQGKAYSAVYTKAVSAEVADIPPREAFDDGSWTWNGKAAGIAPSGAIIGTAPKLLLKEKKSSGIFG